MSIDLQAISQTMVLGGTVILGFVIALHLAGLYPTVLWQVLTSGITLPKKLTEKCGAYWQLAPIFIAGVVIEEIAEGVSSDRVPLPGFHQIIDHTENRLKCLFEVTGFFTRTIETKGICEDVCEMANNSNK